MDCRTPGLPVHHQLPKFAQTHVLKLGMPSNHLILCRPLLLLPSILASISSVQLSHSVMSDSLRPHELQHSRPPCSSQLPESTQTHVHCVGDAIQPSHPLSSPSPPPSIFPSIGVFSNESALRIRWPKYWNFSFNISPSNEYSGLISFRIEWFDLLAVQETLKSLLQHHSSKASILWHSAFFTVQLSHPFMSTGKTIAFE